MGYEAGEIIGKHLSTFCKPSDVAGERPRLNLAAAAAIGRIDEEGWRCARMVRRFGRTSCARLFSIQQGGTAAFEIVAPPAGIEA